MPRLAPASLPLLIEPLESRVLRSVTLINRVLTIVGTPHNDHITVAIDAKHTQQLDVNVNGVKSVYRLKAVSSIKIDAGSGDDMISLGQTGPSLTRPMNIEGGPGNDTILDSNGNDSIDGGSGNDSIIGGNGNDTITGGAGRDYIVDGKGNNQVDGGSGSDTIHAGTGHDTILGGAGNDTLYAGTGGDTINGGDGIDHIYTAGGAIGSLIHGDAGDDVITCGARDTIFGDAGDNHFIGITTGVQDLNPQDNQGPIPCGCGS